MQCESAILSSVACLVLPYFSTSYKRQDVRGGGDIEHKMCVLIFSATLSQIFVILRKN